MISEKETDKIMLENTVKNSKKSGKKYWIIGIITSLVLGIVGFIIYYNKSPKVFTKAEYTKEVIVQNKDFEKALDKFLDQIISYDGTSEANTKLKENASKFSEFVEDLDSKLKSRVPKESKKHYEQMMKAYNIYLEAIDMYVKYVPKNLGEERKELLGQADAKLNEARTAMKSIEE